jgi:hypothetical protein
LVSTGLLQELRSGYDLILIADLVRGGVALNKLPIGRVELYNTMVA